MADDFTNIDTNPPLVYQYYAPPLPTTVLPTVISGDTTIITTINGGGGGQATGPAINLGSNWNGVNFVASAGNVVLDILNALAARTDLGAAANGINTDISQLNGASQVDVSGVYKVDGIQVLREQQPAIANSVGTQPDDTRAINEVLSALRAMGIIAT